MRGKLEEKQETGVKQQKNYPLQNCELSVDNLGLQTVEGDVF